MIFTDGIRPPKVILTDQGAGLRSAYSNGKVFNGKPDLQFYYWHAGTAIKATISKGSYIQEEIEGKDKDTPSISDFYWAYINSRTTTELDANRSQLLRVLHLKQKQYIQET